MALRGGKEPVSLKEVAQRERIPLAYLKRLIKPLSDGGIIRTTRGVGGGVLLAKPAEQIKLREVIELLEGPISLVDCVDSPETCELSGSCVTRDIWREMGQAMSEVLQCTTLQDLVERHKKKEQLGVPMYYI